MVSDFLRTNERTSISHEKLYRALILICTLPLCIVFFVEIYLGRYTDLVFTSFSLVSCIVSFILFIKTRKLVLPIHILLVTFLIILTLRQVYSVPIMSYLVIYPIAFMVAFYFFSGTKTRIAYALLCITLSEVFIVTLFRRTEFFTNISLPDEVITLLISFVLLYIFSQRYVGDLIQADNERAESEKMYKAIVDHSPYGMSLYDSELKRLFISKSTKKVLRYDNLIDMYKTPVLNTLVKEERFRVKNILQALYDGEMNSVKGDFRVICGDGTEGILESVITIIRKEPKEDSLFLVFSNNITEIVEAKKALIEKNEELEKYVQSNIQLENFAYIASHDLRQPLRSILNFSQLLKSKKSDLLDEDANAYLDFIVDSGLRLNNLVNDMLNYSIIGVSGNREMVDIKEMLKVIEEEVELALKEKKGKIEIGEMPCVFGFETELFSLFQNLISNAIKYSKKGKPLQIKIGCEEKEAYWEFSVKDNGLGFNQNLSDRIFSMFQRLENANGIEGTGIGLAHCKKIVELHGGEIWVKSEEGQGSQFFFSIAKQVDNSKKTKATEESKKSSNKIFKKQVGIGKEKTIEAVTNTETIINP